MLTIKRIENFHFLIENCWVLFCFNCKLIVLNRFQLEATQELVKTLSSQLADLRDQMTEQRKQKQRIGLLNNAPSLLNLGLHAQDRM
jgi:hypothetical protein